MEQTSTAKPEASIAKPNGSGRRRTLLLSAILSASIIILDQVVKARIIALIPENRIGVRLMDDFLWIVHTRNLGIAFSIGDSVSRLIRIILFILVPAVFLTGAVLYSFRSKTQKFYSVSIAFIVGGTGNHRRIFRPEGVTTISPFPSSAF